MNSNQILEKIVSLCKRRGFFYQSAEIYDCLNGVWDYGPLGSILARNIEQFWLDYMKRSTKHPLLLFDGAILGSKQMWEASGHVNSFQDPLVDCLSCKKRFRSNDINLEKACIKCGVTSWSTVRQFNMMFKSNLGASEETSNECYLRPETAQTIFTQFKNIITTNRVKVPFGIIQIGKAFRNEITPKHFLFRSREFKQMEMEFFCKPEDSGTLFGQWEEARYAFFKDLGIPSNEIRLNKQADSELAHYAKKTTDIEFNYPFGWQEIEGISYRGCYDLDCHQRFCKKSLEVYDEEKKTSYIPHVIETSIGIERLILLLLCSGYKEDTVDDKIRIWLRLPFFIAPIQIAVFPLSKNEEEFAVKITGVLSQYFRIEYDTAGSIGKRYRRQDEIGTPYCITIDRDSLTTNTVTIRDRDTMEQINVSIEKLKDYFDSKKC